eukprot:1994896-Amphidinium_carterae.1
MVCVPLSSPQQQIARGHHLDGHGSRCGTITDHVKIATIINHFKRPINQHLMLRITSTFTSRKFTAGSGITSIG